MPPPVAIISQEEIAAEENAARGEQKGRVIEIPKLRSITREPSAGPEPVPIGGERSQRWRGKWPTFAFALALVVVLAVALALFYPQLKAFYNHRVVARGIASETVPGERRIAVLPLATAASDDQTRTLADGLVEIITSKLSQIQSFQGKLMIVPASEVRARHITSAEAARTIYGANLVITGSAQRWGNRVQFTLNLVDTSSIRQIDSRTLELDNANPIALRDEATANAIQMLALRLTPEASQSITEGETSTPAAYTAYLKGVGYLARYDVSGNVDHAIESLTEATHLDSRYALAFAALGRAHWLKARINNDVQEKELAIKSTQESIRLSPHLAEGHVSLGEIYADTGRTPEAIQEEWNALRIAPGNAQAYTVLGKAYSSAGQYDQAEAVYQKALQRQPADWHAQLLLGLFYQDRGRISDARSAFQSALKLTPNNELLYRNLAVLDMLEGKFRDASDRIAKTPYFEPVARTYLTLGLAYYYQRRYADAAAAYNSGIKLDPGLYSLWGNLGEVYLHLPDGQPRAKESFLKAIALSEKHLATVESDNMTHACLAQYWATLGRKDKARAEIHKIPEQSLPTFAELIVPTYELLGDRRGAVKMVQALSADNPRLIFIKNDPDLESLWLDPALRSLR